jgi:single-strand DNA-binding protein
MINKVILVGNLGDVPEVRTLENGAKVAKFSMATNENYRDKSGQWQKITEWHNIVAWRYLADKAESSLKKGTLVYVEGKLTHRKYQDKDGIDRYFTEVVANTLKILEKREDASEFQGGNFPSTADEFPTTTTQKTTHEAKGTEEDDLPF